MSKVVMMKRLSPSIKHVFLTVLSHCTNAPGASTYHQPQPHPAERNTVTVRNKNSRSERNTNSSQPMKIYYSDPAVGTMLFATLCSDEQNMNPNRAGMFPEILGGPRQTGTNHTSPLPSRLNLWHKAYESFREC